MGENYHYRNADLRLVTTKKLKDSGYWQRHTFLRTVSFDLEIVRANVTEFPRNLARPTFISVHMEPETLAQLINKAITEGVVEPTNAAGEPIKAVKVTIPPPDDSPATRKLIRGEKDGSHG